VGRKIKRAVAGEGDGGEMLELLVVHRLGLGEIADVDDVREDDLVHEGVRLTLRMTVRHDYRLLIILSVRRCLPAQSCHNPFFVKKPRSSCLGCGGGMQ
jgi:phosphatidate phosphatase APP1